MDFFRLILNLLLLFQRKPKNVDEPTIPELPQCEDGCDVPENAKDVEVLPALPELEEPKEESKENRFCWLIDKPHGALQEGKESPTTEEGEFLKEWIWGSDVVDRITKGLSEKGIEFFVVNGNPENKDAWLRGRVNEANNHKSNLPKIFVSVHGNASGKKGKKPVFNKIEGHEVWYCLGSIKGRIIASVFSRHIATKFPHWRDRQLKVHKVIENVFYVLRWTDMPAILTENGFYTNKKQMREMNSQEGRQKIAEAHINAILEIENKGLNL